MFWPFFLTLEQKIEEPKKLVLRIPRQDTNSLQPYQLRHEVACLQFLAENLPNIPVPRVFLWDDCIGHAFIVQEYIPGQRLSLVWPDLSDDQKASICWSIANVVASLGETRFDFIGGLAQNAHAGPTIEAGKIFNGRVGIYFTIVILPFTMLSVFSTDEIPLS